jgi:ribosome recycling factor
MARTVRHFAEQLAGIRPGGLSAKFLETFRTSIDGGSAPLGRLGAIAQQGDRFLITPFRPDAVSAVVRALSDAKLNAYAFNPRTVCVSAPPVSGEQREQIAQHVKRLGEDAKIAVRAIRQDARKQIAARGRGSERAVQEATDAAIAEIDALVKTKTASLKD